MNHFVHAIRLGVALAIAVACGVAVRAADEPGAGIRYESRDVAGWNVRIQRALLDKQPRETERALVLLRRMLDEVVREVPERAVTELRKVPLYFSPAYGPRGRAEFHPDAGWLRKNGRDPAMAKCVEFSGVDDFEAEMNRMPNFALHELAHAYHFHVLEGGYENAEIKAAFERARSAGAYDRVERHHGNGKPNTFERAYAMSSPMEYFAEATEAFFSRNDFFPFTNEELQRHDPRMFALLTKLWKADASANLDDFRRHAEPFFRKHCVECHGPNKSKGEITLHALNGEFAAGRDVERWERVLEMLESGAMPPEDVAQPGPAERQAVVAWIRAGLRDLDRRERRLAASGATVADVEPTTRRLTNFEYQNTLRDLLGFELKLIDDLPKDPVKPYRFNNTSELMRLGPEQIDLYLHCARRALAAAIVDPVKPETQLTRQEWKSEAEPGKMPPNEVGIWGGNGRFSAASGMGIRKFSQTGEFRVRVKAAAVLPSGVQEVSLRLVMGHNYRSLNSSTSRVEPIGTVRLTNGPAAAEVFEFRGRIENYSPQKNRAKNGDPLPDTLTITPQNLYDDGTLNDENTFQRPRNAVMPRVVVEWMEFESPLVEVWPPEHHTRILFDSPRRDGDPQAYVREVLRRFMSRAYRRPATDEEVDRFAAIYASFLPELKSLEAALRETLALVLVSPQFLFHTAAADGESAAVLKQYELASRLSYFLWGSMPDDELLQLAAEDKLDRPEVIDRQVLRLLADPRSRDFVRNFTLQWLSLEKMRTVPINRDLFPRFLYYVPLGERAGTEEPYRPTIRDYMLDETAAFIAELIRRNGSVMNIVDSDFACLNQPLAAHYGVPGVHGNELRPVPLKPEYRLGGLLTHGSVLIGSGTGSSPHPVYRAVWLREAILGDEVPPPPADVPALTDSAGASAEKASSIKELLVRHRQSESCNDCHSRLDPWGIPFEQYNAIGKFQPRVPKEGTRVGGFDKAKHQDPAGYAAYLDSINTVAVEADSRLPLGPTVDGLDELKAYLLQHRKDDVAENVLRRLLAYGIGRELSWRDRFAVDELLRQAQQNDYRLRDMITSVCRSETFRGR